jgi:peptidoglycan/xylan/chitin deacetylase (PgdA/CDA1 family)
MPIPASPARVAAFTFHEVCDDPHSSGLQRRAAVPYKHSTAQFRATLDSISDAIAASGLKPGLVGISTVILTFDDGGRSATDAARELDRRGWKAHFFLVADFIGRPGFLDDDAIRDLHQAGHGVGNHSATHPDIFRALSPQAMRDEWTRCRDRVEAITGAACTVASVPGGDSSEEVYASAADTGIQYLFTSEPTPQPFSHGECLVLGRANVKADTSPERCGRLARFEGWQRERSVYQAKQAARKLLSPVYRAYVHWSTRPFEQER